MKYDLKDITRFIFDLSLDTEALDRIEDYVYNSLYIYNKYELKCIFDMLEIRREIERRGFRSQEELIKEWKSKLM